MFEVSVRNNKIPVPDGLETVIVIHNTITKRTQTFRTFTFNRKNRDEEDFLKYFGWHIQELGQMISKTGIEGDLVDDKETKEG